ncbi:MAG: histone deacetylase family protein, partial [Ideonella sp.]
MTTAYFTHTDCRSHDMGRGHPECPQRLDAIEDHLLSTGLDVALTRFDVPLASHSDLMLAHSEGYLLELQEFMQQAAETGEHRALDPDTMVCPHTWRAALRAAGAAVAATDAVLNGQAQN